MTPKTIAKYEAISAALIASGLTLEAYCEREGLNALTVSKAMSRARRAGGNCPDVLAVRAKQIRDKYAATAAICSTITEVAQALGVSRSVASKYLSRRGLKPQRIARRSLTHNLSRCRAARAKVTPSDFAGLVTSVYVADVAQRPIRLVEIARRGMGFPLLMTPAQADALRGMLV